jgi:cysteine desulfurase
MDQKMLFNYSFMNQHRSIEAGRIYFDNAATTQMHEEVLYAMLPYLTRHYGNPSAVHGYGRETRLAVEQARKTVAGLMGAKPGNIVFTSGGTESNNMAIACALRDLGCNHIITSKVEHHAVLHTVEYYSKTYRIEVSYVKIYEDGAIDQNDFRKILEQKAAEGKKCLVSLMHANNETGQLTEISWIGALCRKHGAIYHSDCVPTIGHLPIQLVETGVHLASASAHKFHGPKGAGFLYVADELKLLPLIHGGAQERGLRAGTENVSGIVGLAKALEIVYQNLQTDQLHISRLKQHLATSLRKHFPKCIINSGRFSLYTILSVSFPKEEQTEALLFDLDQNGICAAGGSACSGGDSHVMKALEKSDRYVTIRFSFSKYNTLDEGSRLVEVLKRVGVKEGAMSNE